MTPSTPELLAQLHDIHPPSSVPWWPLAPGWWIVLAALLLLSLFGWWFIRRHQQQRWQRQASKQLHQEMEALRKHYQQTDDGIAAAAAISSLMRRVALQCFPEADIAGAHGERWLQFLDQHHFISDRFLGSPLGEMLLHAPYAPHAVNPELLIERAQAWMEAAIQSANKTRAPNRGEAPQ